MTPESGTIWVTRSEPGASRLASRLKAAGFPAVALPLLEIEPVPEATLGERAATLETFDVGIALSGHAVAVGLPVLLERVPAARKARWLAVGARTAAELRRCGLAAESPERQSSEGILAAESLAEVANKRVLLLCGVGGRELLGRSLRKAGARVDRFEAYRRVPVALDAAARQQLGKVDVVLAASAEVGPPLADALSASAWQSVRVIAASERIAQRLGRLGFSRVMVAEGPGDEAMMTAVRQCRGEVDD